MRINIENTRLVVTEKIDEESERPLFTFRITNGMLDNFEYHEVYTLTENQLIALARINGNRAKS